MSRVVYVCGDCWLKWVARPVDAWTSVPAGIFCPACDDPIDYEGRQVGYNNWKSRIRAVLSGGDYSQRLANIPPNHVVFNRAWLDKQNALSTNA